MGQRKGYKLTKEHKLKISIAHRGIKFTKEHKLNISRHHADFSGKNHPLYGTHRSDKTKRKISKKLKGRVLTKEWKNKIGKSVSGKRNGMYKYKYTKKLISRMSKAQLGKRVSKEVKNTISIGMKKRWLDKNFRKKLIVHHLDLNHYNDNKDNRIRISRGLHRLIHHPAYKFVLINYGIDGILKYIKYMKLVMKNKELKNGK